MVLSTDIAESSLTVSGVRIVVDAGLARVPRHDLGSGMTRLTTVSTSRASADQRAGRAGRTEPGVAYRLWSKLEHATRRAHLEAEITQVDLAGVALELAAWGTPVGELALHRSATATRVAAGPRAARAARRDRRGRPTDLDRTGDACTAAAPPTRTDGRRRSRCRQGSGLLDRRDPRRTRRVARHGPTSCRQISALRVRVVCGHDHHERADRRDVARIRDRAADIARRSDVHLDFDDVAAEHTGAAVGSGFPDRVAVRRRQPGQFQMRTGNGCLGCGDRQPRQRAVHRRRRPRRQPHQRPSAHRCRHRAGRTDSLAGRRRRATAHRHLGQAARRSGRRTKPCGSVRWCSTSSTDLRRSATRRLRHSSSGCERRDSPS